MPILIKLLATRIVANSFLGRSNNFEITLNFFELLFNPVSISDFVNEKKATSAPEINAEQSSKIKSNISPETNDTFIESIVIIKLVGSGSKVNHLSLVLFKTEDHQCLLLRVQK